MTTASLSIRFPEGCQDRPDPRDWASRDVCGAAAAPVSVTLWRTDVQDQTKDEATRYACTVFGMTHCSNEGNALEAERANVPRELIPQDWASSLVPGAVDAGWLDPKKGASLQDAVRHFRDGPGLIAGWARCDGFDDVLAALGRGNPVFTGSNQANWAESARTGVFTHATSSYGHAFALDGCEIGETRDLDFVWIRNSGGPKWGLAGRCKLYRKDFPKLFTCYEILDKSNADTIAAYRKKMDEKAIAALVAAGVTNGQRPDDAVSRRECWLMLARLADPKVLAAVQAGLAK
jgi:hypothetical protein